MKSKFTFLSLIVLFAFSTINAQVPAGGATGVSIITTYDVPAAAGTLVDATDYKIAVFDDATGLTLIGISAVIFTYNIGAGNAGIPAISVSLTNNTAYKWIVYDPTTIVTPGVPLLSEGLYGPFSFTTILGPPTATAATAITNTTFTANWTAHSQGGATSYIIDVGTTPGGTDILSASNVGNVLTYIVTGLTANTFYYYKVRAYDGTYTSSNSNEITAHTNFLTSVANPSQGNYALGVSVLPTFTWLAVAGATTYDLEVSTSSTFIPLVTLASSSGIAGTTYSVVYPEQLTNATLYYWRVRDNNSGLYSSTWEFNTVIASLPTINPIVPSVASAFVGWYPVPYSSGLKYDLTYSLNSNMSAPLGTFSDLTVTYYSLTGLSNNTTYYVQVRSKNSTGTVINSYSTIVSFTTLGPPKPIRSYPIDAVTVYASKPTFFWYIEGNEPGLDYQIRYRTSSGSYSGVQVATTANKLYNTITVNLTAGETYVWQVRSFVGSSYSNWSTAGDSTFTIFSSVATVPPVPIASWPDGSPTPTIYSNPPVMYYYIDVYATGLEFQVEYSTASTLVGGAGTGFATAPVSLGWTTDLFSAVAVSLIPGSQYYWHVRSRLLNAPFTASAYSATATFIVATTASGAATTPIPSFPVGGIILDSPLSGITLSWSAPATESLDYQVRIAQSSSVDGVGKLNHPLAKETTANGGYAVTDPTKSILVSAIPSFTLTAGATYYWQVRSRLTATPAIFSPWSMIASFSTAAGSSSVVPLVISPNYLQPIKTNSAMLTWQIPVPSESRLSYDVQYSKSADFSDAITKKDLNEPVTQVTGLTAGTVYYWRVLSKTDNGSVSGYSSTGSFKTSGTTAVEDQEILPTAFELSQNYPNPFNPTTIISYALPKNAFVTLKVYDMLGREVTSLVNKEMLAGNHSVEWNGADQTGNKVASGAYIYRISAGNFISTKKMIMLK